jgi:hypothetical protein
VGADFQEIGVYLKIPATSAREMSIFSKTTNPPQNGSVQAIQKFGTFSLLMKTAGTGGFAPKQEDQQRCFAMRRSIAAKTLASCRLYRNHFSWLLVMHSIPLLDGSSITPPGAMS